MGIRARDAAPAVAAALKDSDPNVRIAAANALGAMQPRILSAPERAMLQQAVNTLWTAGVSGDVNKIVQPWNQFMQVQSGVDSPDVLNAFEEVARQKRSTVDECVKRIS